MKCHICGAEMVNTVGGCWHCENCKIGGVDDLVLRYPNLNNCTDKQETKLVDKMSSDTISSHMEHSGLPGGEESEVKLLYKAVMREFADFVEDVRKEILGLTLTPELTALSVRNQDLSIFNKLAGDCAYMLDALFDGPPCEGWEVGSACRTCPNTGCISHRHNNKFYPGD